MIPSVPIPNRGEALRASWAQQIAGAVNSLSALANNGGAKWTNLRDRRGGAVVSTSSANPQPFDLGYDEDGNDALLNPYFYLGSRLVSLSSEECTISRSGLVAIKFSFDDLSVSIVNFPYGESGKSPMSDMFSDQEAHKKEYAYIPLYLFAAPDENGEESGEVVLDLRSAPRAHIWDT